ncbi:ParB family protein [Serratia fonticola]
MKPNLNVVDLQAKMMSGYLQRTMPAPAVSSLPAPETGEVPMVLTLDELRPNPDNPRTQRNPRYADIKASIASRGLDSVPKVTKDPANPAFFIFSDGGNTRYAILQELWAETQDERFYRIACYVKPWPGRLMCLLGHLAENDLRGNLSFVERAKGVVSARELYEQENGQSLSLRALSERLRADGYAVHPSNIQRMEYTVNHLLPVLPTLLEGLGRQEIEKLIALHTSARKVWFEQTNTSDAAIFNPILGEVCKDFDSEEAYSFEGFRAALTRQLQLKADKPELTYDHWLLALQGENVTPRGVTSGSVVSSIAPDERAHEALLAPVRDSLHGDIEEEATGVSAPAPLANTLGSALTVHPNERVTADPNPRVTDPRLESGYQEEQLPLAGEAMSSPSSSLLPPLTPPDSSALRSPIATPPALPPLLSATDDHDCLPFLPDEDVMLAFADSGLEPVSDIWAISPLQDDIEHLQGSAFRLAFELAEHFELGACLVQDTDPTCAGFKMQRGTDAIDPNNSLAWDWLNELSGQAMLLSLDFLLGTASESPAMSDFLMVKLMRLLRVLRRLRELQREENGHV